MKGVVEHQVLFHIQTSNKRASLPCSFAAVSHSQRLCSRRKADCSTRGVVFSGIARTRDGETDSSSLLESPIELVSGEDSELSKVDYVLTLRTGVQRGASLSEPLCGMFVCFIGEDKRSFLHLIPPVDSQASQRFLQGSTDSVSISCPDIGEISGMLVGPECGTWNLEEVTLQRVASDEILRFVCGKTLGTRNDPAAVLLPLRPDKILYGSGSIAKQLTKEEAFEVQLGGLDAYASLKQAILSINAGLVIVGTVCEALVWNLQFASLFAVGGIGGLAYQFLLQENVDTIGTREEAIQKDGLRFRLLSNPLSRVVLSILIIGLAYLVIRFTEQEPVVNSALPYKAKQLLNFAAGLLTFKVSVLLAALIDSSDQEKNN